MNRRGGYAVAAALLAFVCACACSTTTVGTGAAAPTPTVSPSASTTAASTPIIATRPTASSSSSDPDSRPPGEFTVSFAGDVHFEERTATRLAANPATVFAQAAPGLAAADLTMVNLETAITTGGTQQGKEFTFRAPPVAFTALRDAGIDIATMANNHGADYGASGLRDTLAAIRTSKFPVVGIGANAAAAYAPWVTTVRGVKIAIFAATQVRDETLANFTAGTSSPGVASAYSPLLIAGVKAAKAAGELVIVYVHWGTEFVTCPNSDQRTLATALAAAGATAVIGTHAHVLQGAGWLPDGVYVAYGLGNFLWWRSFGNNQDDNGVLTLTFLGGRVVASHFAAAHLDGRGVPVPATGSTLTRINAEWASVRSCTSLSAKPPA